MFVALDENDHRLQLVSHTQAAYLQASGMVARCPLCRESLQIRNGAQVPPYFAHQAHSPCVASSGESAEHMAGKLLLQAAGRQAGWRADLEVIVGDGSQRIDVLLSQGNRRIALEFQCSPLSNRRLAERTQGYQDLGFEVQWYLGRRYRQDRTAAGRLKFATWRAGGLRLQYVDVQHRQFLVDSAVNLNYWTRQVVWPDAGVPSLCGRMLSPRQAAVRLARQVRMTTQGKLRQIQNYCYERGCQLAGCPWIVHEGLINRPGFDLSVELLRVIWLLEFGTDTNVSAAADQEFWRTHADPLQLPLVAMPDYCQTVAQEFTAELERQGYLAPTQKGWRWCRQPEWFADIDAKMQRR